MSDTPNPTSNGTLLGSAEHPVVIVRRHLRATPAEVWSAWTDPERLVRWLGAVDGALTTPGHTVHIAMAATELPPDPSSAENPARFTVRDASPPSGDQGGRLEFVFDDAADPGGIVTVTMSPEGDGCLLVLRHVLAEAATAIDHVAGFGAGWEGFLEWLDDVLAGREHGADDLYEALLPIYEADRDRLARVPDGVLDEATAAAATVRHERLLDAPIERVWELLTTADGLVTWLGRVTEGELGDGSRVAIVHGQSPSGDQVQRSLVTAWEPTTRLAMTWEFTGESTSSVEITLRAETTPRGASTHLVLEHRDLAAMAEDYLAGWHAHLDVLGAVAEARRPVPWQDAFDAATAIAALSSGATASRRA